MAIPFKTGLTAAQQQSITNLVAARPTSQWTDIDKRNWAYATNNAPLPAPAAPTPPPAPVAAPAAPSSANRTQAVHQGVIPSVDRQQLQTYGVDVSGLSDDQVKTLAMMKSVIDLNAQKNRDLVPKQLTTQEMNKFLEDARAELAPYYGEQFESAKRDLIQNTSYLTGEQQYQEQQLQQQFMDQQQQMAEQAAEAGLARSGLRQQAESKLQEQQKGLVLSNRRKLSQQAYQLGSGFEQAYGAQRLGQAGLPQFSSQAFPMLGLGAQQIPYTPQGIKLGQVGAAQTTSEQQRAQQLQLQELQKRQGLMQ